MKKILVVEDDEFLANAYRVKLTKTGFDVRIVADGEAALSSLEEFAPHLMLLDLVIPKKDGFAVLEEIRASKKWHSLPVLIASNLGQKEDIERGMSMGANDFVIKSDFTLDDVVKKINGVLGE